MAEDYASAAMRHHSDANFLRGDSRHDNSGYLAGYVVECSFKALIVCCGGPSGPALGHDLANLAGPALTLAALLAPEISRYDVVDDPDVRYLLGVWKPESRYSSTGSLAAEESEKRARAAQVCIDRLLVPLILDGVVEAPQ